MDERVSVLGGSLEVVYMLQLSGIVVAHISALSLSGHIVSCALSYPSMHEAMIHVYTIDTPLLEKFIDTTGASIDTPTFTHPDYREEIIYV